MKKKFVDYFMDVAERTSQLSYAKRLQVGALIVKDDRIISIGYNGMPTGWDNNCEDKEWCSAGGWLSPEEIEEQWPFKGTYLDSEGNLMEGRYKLKTKPEVLHAETNAISKLAKSNEAGDDSVMFCTHAPCIDCAKLIYQSGISRLIYRDTYRSTDGINFLTKSGVHVTKYEAES
jgi:dCMP deaminase